MTSMTFTDEAPTPLKGGNPLIVYRNVRKAFGKNTVYKPMYYWSFWCGQERHAQTADGPAGH